MSEKKKEEWEWTTFDKMVLFLATSALIAFIVLTLLEVLVK